MNNELTKKEKIIKEVKSIALIVVLVLGFKSSFFQPFKIPSGSMIPTIMIGDFILVNKMSYGFKLPFSDFSFGPIDFSPIYLFGKSNPERGDVIVFKYPKEPELDYIKRVIGLPGDKIEVIDKVVYVNGEAIHVENIDGAKIMENMDESFKKYNFEFLDAKIGDKNFNVLYDKNNPYTMNFREITVPENHFFVMGDNRDFSADSRMWGFVPHENIRGKAMFVWFALNLPSGENPFSFRPWRIGTSIN